MADGEPETTRGSIGNEIFEQVEKIVAEEGLTRTQAFQKLSEQTGRRAGTVAANYYRVARRARRAPAAAAPSLREPRIGSRRRPPARERRRGRRGPRPRERRDPGAHGHRAQPGEGAGHPARAGGRDRPAPAGARPLEVAAPQGRTGRLAPRSRSRTAGTSASPTGSPRSSANGRAPAASEATASRIAPGVWWYEPRRVSSW